MNICERCEQRRGNTRDGDVEKRRRSELEEPKIWMIKTWNKQTLLLVGGLEHFFHILWMSSSFFRGVGIPPTRLPWASSLFNPHLTVLELCRVCLLQLCGDCLLHVMLGTLWVQDVPYSLVKDVSNGGSVAQVQIEAPRSGGCKRTLIQTELLCRTQIGQR